MEFLGVGPLELLFILIIALIVLGPKDMVKSGRTIGRFLRKLVKSSTWQTVQQTSRDIRYLPNKLMRDAGLEEEAEELKSLGKEIDELSKVKTSFAEDLKKTGDDLQRDLSAWTTPQPESGSTIASPPPPTLDPRNSEPVPPADSQSELPAAPQTAPSDIGSTESESAHPEDSNE